MRSTRTSALIATTLLLGAFTSGYGEESIPKLIKQLDSEEFAAREDAQRVLRQIGKEALPALTTALQSASLEVAARIKLTVSDIEKDLQNEAAHERERRAVVKVYYVKDLLDGPAEFTGPSLVLGDDIYPRQQRNRRDDRADENLIAMIKSTIEPQSWESQHFSASLYRSTLIVSHTPETQEKVGALLNALRVESEPQMTIECLLLHLKEGVQADQYSAADFESYLHTLPSDALVMKSRLATSNLHRAVAIDGKQVEYIAESRVYSMESGAMTNSIQARQCLDGASLSVFPRLNSSTGAVNMELRFSRTSGLALREVGELEKFITTQSTTLVPLAPATPAQTEHAAEAKPEVASKNADRSKIKWSLPSSEIQLLSTDLSIPKDAWVCAGRIQQQKKEGAAADPNPKENGEYLFIHVQMAEPKVARQP